MNFLFYFIFLKFQTQKAETTYSFKITFPFTFPSPFPLSLATILRLRNEAMSSTRSGRHRRPSSSSSSISSISLLKSIKEPPRNFFPSKDEFLRLVAVLAIASSVAVCCNIFFTLINRQPKPFCDSHNSHSPDSISGTYFMINCYLGFCLFTYIGCNV